MTKICLQCTKLNIWFIYLIHCNHNPSCQGRKSSFPHCFSIRLGNKDQVLGVILYTTHVSLIYLSVFQTETESYKQISALLRTKTTSEVSKVTAGAAASRREIELCAFLWWKKKIHEQSACVFLTRAPTNQFLPGRAAAVSVRILHDPSVRPGRWRRPAASARARPSALTGNQQTDWSSSLCTSLVSFLSGLSSSAPRDESQSRSEPRALIVTVLQEARAIKHIWLQTLLWQFNFQLHPNFYQKLKTIISVVIMQLKVEHWRRSQKLKNTTLS